MAVALGLRVALEVRVAVGVGVAVKLRVAVAVGVKERVRVMVGVGVAVRVGELVMVADRVRVGLGVRVGLASVPTRVGGVTLAVVLGVGEKLTVAVGVRVAGVGGLLVAEGLIVTVGSAVRVRVGVLEASTVGVWVDVGPGNGMVRVGVCVAEGDNVPLGVGVGDAGVAGSCGVHVGVRVAGEVSVGVRVAASVAEAEGLAGADGDTVGVTVGGSTQLPRAATRSAAVRRPSLLPSAATQSGSDPNSPASRARRSRASTCPSQFASPGGKIACAPRAASARPLVNKRDTARAATTLEHHFRAAMDGGSAYTHFAGDATRKMPGTSPAEAFAYRPQKRNEVIKSFPWKVCKAGATRAKQPGPVGLVQLSHEKFSPRVVNCRVSPTRALAFSIFP